MSLRFPILLATVLSGALVSTSALAWWNADWTQRTRIVLNTSAAGVETKAAINDVVVPVRLHAGNFDFLAAKPDGADLRFVAGDDKTELPFRIERYDGTNELGLVWVRIPAVQPGTDANVIYAYAGNDKAAAAPAAPLFDESTKVAIAFGGTTGPATDADGALASTTPINRNANGQLGASAVLAGDAVQWPASDRLRAPAAGPFAVNLWVRPETAPQGDLVRLGGLRIALAAGKVTAAVGPVTITGGDAPPGAWTHIALTVAGGKAQLFLNGTPSGEAAAGDGAGPDGTLVVGGGFTGQIDELRFATSARSADWWKFEHAVQSADPKLVATFAQTPDNADSDGASPGYFGILVKNLTVDAWVVIVILGVMFVVAVWVMITKALLIRRTDRANRRFLQRFRDARGNLLGIDEDPAFAASPLHRLYRAGVRELEARDAGRPGATLGAPSLHAVKVSIDADLVRESDVLNSRMVLLTIAISGGPFLGLLGTVVGVMITFAAIAAAGDVNVNAIAPGIAAALLATVAGLAVAIPALFAYNYLASRLKSLASAMQVFVEEFVARAGEQFAPGGEGRR